MPTDRERWDAKWAGAEAPEPVDAFVAEALELVSPIGRALDLASGVGRHALELAARGFDVEAWDVSPVGLARLEEFACARGLTVATRCVDLVGGGPMPATEAFELVCVASFLHRPLLAGLDELVVPGGHLIYVTFTREWPGEKPPARFRLEPGELARGLPGFETLKTREDGGRAGLLARRPMKTPG